MTFAIVLGVSLLICWLFRNFIKDNPIVCYGIAIALDTLYLYGYFFGLPRGMWLVLSILIQKCMLALALFTIVMYIGVLPRKVKSSTSLLAIRSNMSIMACYLALAHMGVYLGTYVTSVFSGAAVKSNVLASFIVALAVFVLLLVLGVTSFRFVKHRMSGAAWKNVQKLAYPFFSLTFVHLAIVLAPAAAHGGAAAQTTIGVYSVVFSVYAVLRVYRVWVDGREAKGRDVVGAAGEHGMGDELASAIEQ